MTNKYLTAAFIAAVAAPLSVCAADYNYLARVKQLAPYYDYSAVNLAQCEDPSDGAQVLKLNGAHIGYLVCDGNTYYAFVVCESGYYENMRGQPALFPYRYPGDTQVSIFFQDFCRPCPTTTDGEGNVYSGKITSDYATHNGNITDCRIPAGTLMQDSTGTYTFSDDCYYTE